MISDRLRGHTYDQIDAWPLDRVLAANDLIDEIARAETEHAEQVRAEARQAAKERSRG